MMISVCMATYNGERYIRQQIDSILPQLGEGDELVISDDESTDGTKDIVESFNDARIKWIDFVRDKKGMLPVHLATTNFENAVRHAQGDVIFLSDQDDVWLPDKVKVMMHYIVDEDYDYVESECFLTDENLKVTGRFSHGSKCSKWRCLLFSNPIQGSLCAFKRKILDDALPFPRHIQSHDRWIGYVAMFKYRTLIPIDKELIYYRRHYQSTIMTSPKNSVWIKAMERLRYSWHLFWRLLSRMY